MGLIRTARLRPDQTQIQNEEGMLYTLSELIAEAREHESELKAFDDIDPTASQHWGLIVRWLEKKQKIARGIHPFTGKPFTQDELDMLRLLEEGDEPCVEF